MEATINIPWSVLEPKIASRSLQPRYFEVGNAYVITVTDGPFVYGTAIPKSATVGYDETQRVADQADFEANYKTVADNPVVTHRPTFSLGQYHFRGNGATATCAAGGTANLDFKMPENRLLSGGEVVVSGSQIFDWVKFQVIDIDGVTFAAGTVIDEYVEKWHINPTSGDGRISMDYAGSVTKNWWLRLVYNADAAGSERKVAINYFLHKPV